MLGKILIINVQVRVTNEVILSVHREFFFSWWDRGQKNHLPSYTASQFIYQTYEILRCGRNSKSGRPIIVNVVSTMTVNQDPCYSVHASSQSIIVVPTCCTQVPYQQLICFRNHGFMTVATETVSNRRSHCPSYQLSASYGIHPPETINDDNVGLLFIRQFEGITNAPNNKTYYLCYNNIN